jgi:threonylcarbamoyladenosine tRNA methylthiotransferase MtaB
MKVSVLTLGCRVNQSESNIIEGNLSERGWSVVGLSEHPDYCIVNTCSVTSKSDYQSRQLIRRAVRTGAKVIVTGCYSQLRPDEIKRIEGVNCIINNNDKLHIINMLSNNTERITFSHSRKSRPYIKVQDGCNFSCSYCVVPMARGRSRSLNASEVIKQVKEIEASGYSEIVLTGIHLGSYGYDITPKTKLSELITTILEETKIRKIRLSSIESKEVDDELIELLQDKRLCKHIHLPLQSGNETILKIMNRMYTYKDFVKTIENIIQKIPDIAIGTDIIVGFPGESNKEFNDTKKLLEYMPFSYIHIFPFSSRPGTIAFKMAHQCNSDIKKERINELKAINSKKKMDYMLSQLHKTLEVVIEENGNEGTSLGTSSNYLKVKMNSNGYPNKTLVSVRASEIEGNLIRGDLIDIL